MKIRMLRTVTGTCDGQQTRFNAIVDVGDASARDYIKNGYAEAVEEEKVEEVVEEKVEEVEIDRSGVQTAEAAPPQNAAEHVEKLEPRRGPGRPRKYQ